MAQLSMTPMDVNSIINRALRVIRAESYFQDENQDARQYVLDALNDILAIMDATGEYIPFYSTLDFSLITSQATYTIGTAVDSTVIIADPIDTIDYVNILIDQYRYPVIIQDNFAFLGITLSLNITGRPSYVRINQLSEDQTQLNFYPAPNQAYTCELLYKKQIRNVNYQETIALPLEYRAFLVYWLAKRISSEGGYGTWSQINEQEYQRMDTILKAATAKDTRVRSYPPFNPYPGNYYWNLGVRT